MLVGNDREIGYGGFCYGVGDVCVFFCLSKCSAGAD